MEDIGRKKI